METVKERCVSAEHGERSTVYYGGRGQRPLYMVMIRNPRRQMLNQNVSNKLSNHADGTMLN